MHQNLEKIINALDLDKLAQNNINDMHKTSIN